MAAEKETAPLAGRIIPEPEWQNPALFTVPAAYKQPKQKSSNEWKLPSEMTLEMENRIAGVSAEVWGKQQKDKSKCQVCLMYKKKNHFHPLRGCTHRPYCAQCVGKAVKEELHGKGLHQIKCVSPDCKVQLEPDDIQRCCTRADYERYCNLSTNRVLESMDDFRHCTNKSNGCGSGQIHDPGDGDENIMKCHVCGWSTCYYHKEQMHFGLTCDEYDVWREASHALAKSGSEGDEIQLTEALLQQKSRKCPDCGVLITKMGTFEGDNEEEACHHMTCPNQSASGVCGAEFCWLCGGYYYGGDPTKRKKVRQCHDANHNQTLSGYGGTLLHCHHKVGCARG